MGEKNNFAPLGNCRTPDPICCITANKVFDSARDKDCLEDIRVLLCERDQDTIDHASAVRCKGVEVITVDISIDPVTFNCGYFQVLIRYFLCVSAEACVGGKPYEIKGLAVFDKKVILFGGEKNVRVFHSDPKNNSFCRLPSKLDCDVEPDLPHVALEVACPVCLDIKLVENHRSFGNCCCCAEAVPDHVSSRFDGRFNGDDGVKGLFVSVGIFSVIRMERPVQLLIPSSKFCMPEKESVSDHGSSDPCHVFSKMNFPVEEFFPFVDGGKGERPHRGCCN